MRLLVLIENVYIVVTEVIAVSCKYTQSSLVYANTPNQLVQAPIMIQPHSDGVCNKLAYPAAAQANLWCSYIHCNHMTMSFTPA